MTEFSMQTEDYSARESILAATDSRPASDSIKFVVVGDRGVGKSSLISQYFHKTSQLAGSPGDVAKKVVDVKSKHYNGRISLEAVDADCTKKTLEESEALYSDAHGIFLIYDVTNRDSFDNMVEHLMEVADYGTDDTMIFFIANKCDVPAEERIVTVKEGNEFKEEYGGFMYEVSALTGDQVTVAFEAMTYAAVAILSSTHEDEDEDADAGAVTITEVIPPAAPNAAERTSAAVAEAVADTTPPKLTAWIDKRSKYLQFWNNRYFTLVSGQIMFQRTDKLEEHKNGLTLTKNCELLIMGDFQLEILSPAYKDMMLRFSKRSIRDAWREAIQHHCDWGTMEGHEDYYAK